MAGPWEKYQAQPSTPQPQAQSEGPWAKYQAPTTEPAPAVQQGDITQRSAPFKALIDQVAAKYQLDPRVLTAQIDAESSFNPKAVSPKGASGLMQLMPGTATELGVRDAFDPAQSIEAGARYLRQNLDKYHGNLDAALAAYNWGPGNLDRNGLKKIPKETRDYIAKIRANAGDPDVPMPGAQPERFVDVTTPQGMDQDFANELQTFEKTAIDKGWRGADYYNRKADIMERYRKETGKVPDFAGLEDFARGLPQGMQGSVKAVGQVADPIRWLPEGAERTVNQALGRGDRTQAQIEQEEEEAALQRYRKSIGQGGMDIGNLVGSLMDPGFAGLTGAVKLPGALANLGPKTKAGLEAATRGGLAGLLSPTVPEGDESLPVEKAKQVAGGAIAGPIFDAAGRSVINAAGRVAGAVKNKMASDEVQHLADLSKKWGVNLLAGDYDTNRRFIRGMEGRLINSQIPFLNIELSAQQTQGRKAAEKLLKIQNQELQNVTYQGLGAVQQAAKTGGKRAEEAQAVLRMVDEAGEDARKVIQASGNLKWLRMKLSADQLYDDVERMAGKADVQPKQTLQALNKALRDAERKTDKDTGYIKLLNDWIDNLNNGPARGQVNTYMDMRDFRTSLKSRKEDAANTAGILEASRLSINDVIKAVEDDMNAFAASKPALKAANDRANKFYRDRVRPFQADSLAKALKSDDPDAVYGAFVRTGAEWKGDATQHKLYKALDEKGKAAVRAGMIQDAFKQATDPEHFTPTGFNKVLRSTGYETFFQGSSRRELDGLMHLMDHISRSDPAKLAQFQPMIGTLGATTAVAGVAGGGLGIAAVAAGLASSGAMKWLVTTDAGRRLLYSANLYKPGSAKGEEALTRILENARNQITTAAGRSAGQEIGKPGTVLP